MYDAATLSLRSVGICSSAASVEMRLCSLPIRRPPVRSYIHIVEPSSRASRRGRNPSLVNTGSRNGSTRTRCGAVRRSTCRSASASYTRRTSRCCRYRMPPCTSFEDFDDVPEAKSPFSINAVRRPRDAASSATPAPVMPPPTTRTSNGSSARRWRLEARSNPSPMRRSRYSAVLSVPAAQICVAGTDKSVSNNDCKSAVGVDRVPAVKTPAELTELFRARGLKVTPQRQAIFHVLHGETTHPTAEAVYEAVSTTMPTISLRTVYQTLNDLAAMGEVLALDLGTG